MARRASVGVGRRLDGGHCRHRPLQRWSPQSSQAVVWRGGIAGGMGGLARVWRWALAGGGGIACTSGVVAAFAQAATPALLNQHKQAACKQLQAAWIERLQMLRLQRQLLKLSHK